MPEAKFVCMHEYHRGVVVLLQEHYYLENCSLPLTHNLVVCSIDAYDINIVAFDFNKATANSKFHGCLDLTSNREVRSRNDTIHENEE